MKPQPPAAQPLTNEQILLERTQFIAASCALLFLGGWIAWFYPFDDLLNRSGTPLGADYAFFYVVGDMVLDGAGDQLYDGAEHQRRLHSLLPRLRPDFAFPNQSSCQQHRAIRRAHSRQPNTVVRDVALL